MKLYRVQTPQIFDVALLRRAFSYVTAHNLVVTDDASMVEALGHPVSLVEGLEENFKITTPEDFYPRRRRSQKGADCHGFSCRIRL